MLQTCLLNAIYHPFFGGLEHIRGTSVLGLSAFVLVCVHVGSEIGRFMFALLLPGEKDDGGCYSGWLFSALSTLIYSLMSQ